MQALRVRIPKGSLAMGLKRPFEVRHPWKGKKVFASPRGCPSAGHPKTRLDPPKTVREKTVFASDPFSLFKPLGRGRQGGKLLRRQLVRRVFYGIENTHERAERSIQPDIRFMLRTVPQEKLPSLSARARPVVMNGEKGRTFSEPGL